MIKTTRYTVRQNQTDFYNKTYTLEEKIIEGGTNGFESIPASIYWAIVTTTTVGYGDITPTTDLGKIISSIMMIVGYVIIAVPTGLISVELSRYREGERSDNLCEHCGHDNPFGSVYCNQCGKEVING